VTQDISWAGKNAGHCKSAKGACVFLLSAALSAHISRRTALGGMLTRTLKKIRIHPGWTRQSLHYRVHLCGVHQQSESPCMLTYASDNQSAAWAEEVTLHANDLQCVRISREH
jgi:hypothetical protein